MTTMTVVGAGAAGVSAACAARRAGFAGRIVVLSDQPHLPYELPPLTKSLTPERRLIVPEATYRELDLDLRLEVSVGAVRGNGDGWILTDRSDLRHRSDLLVWAAGGAARRPELPGVDLPGVHVVRDVADATALVEALAEAERVVVVGAGVLGLEAAALARTAGRSVTVVEAAPVVLGGRFDQAVAGWTADLHAGRGVRLRCSTPVRAFRGRDRVDGVELGSGEVLAADLVVLAAGMVPRTGPVLGLGVHDPASGVLVVDGAGRTGHPHLFAAGDVAAVRDTDGALRRHEHWTSALEQGERVGTVLAGGAPRPAAAAYAWSDQFGHRLSSVGSPRPGNGRAVRRSDRGLVVFHHEADGRVRSVQAVDGAADVASGRRLVTAGVRVDPQQLADPDVTVRSLLRVAAR